MRGRQIVTGYSLPWQGQVPIHARRSLGHDGTKAKKEKGLHERHREFVSTLSSIKSHPWSNLHRGKAETVTAFP